MWEYGNERHFRGVEVMASSHVLARGFDSEIMHY